MRKKIALFTETSKDKRRNFRKTRSTNLSVINSTSWSELNETLATQMIIDFDADFVSILMKEIDTIYELDHIHFHDKKLLVKHCWAINKHNAQACEQRKWDLCFNRSNEADICGASRNEACRGGGFLCIGSNEPTMFSQEIDTMFVRYMADVLACVINRLIEL